MKLPSEFRHLKLELDEIELSRLLVKLYEEQGLSVKVDFVDDYDGQRAALITQIE